MNSEIRNRKHVYLNDDIIFQLAEISEFLKSSQSTFKQERSPYSQIINLRKEEAQAKSVRNSIEKLL